LLVNEPEENVVGETCSTQGWYDKCINILVRKPEGRNALRDLGVDRDNIKMYLEEMGY